MACRESLLRAAAHAPQHRQGGRRGVQALPGRTRTPQGGSVDVTSPRVVPANVAGTIPGDDTQTQNGLSPSPGISAGLGPGAAQRKRRSFSAIATSLMLAS